MSTTKSQIRKTFDFHTRNEKRKKKGKLIRNLSGIRIRYEEIQWVFQWAIFIGYNFERNERNK